jgi:hypothetical protein
MGLTKGWATAITLVVATIFFIHGLSWNKEEHWPLTRWPMYARAMPAICPSILSLRLEVTNEAGKRSSLFPQQLARYSKIEYDYILGVRYILGTLQKQESYKERLLDSIEKSLKQKMNLSTIEIFVDIWNYPFEIVHEKFREGAASSSYLVGSIAQDITFTPLALAKPEACRYELSFLQPFLQYE